MRVLPLWILAASCCCSTSPRPVEVAAEGYVALALALDRHHAGYVDAYLSPDRPTGPSLSLAEIESSARTLLAGIETAPSARAQRLSAELRALGRFAETLKGEPLRFDDELLALYGVVAPPRIEGGRAPIATSSTDSTAMEFLSRDGLDAEVRLALAECRKRGQDVFELPDEESVTVEYVHGKVWSAYHHYLGGYESVVQINRDVRWTKSQLLEAVCHESYLGHHAISVATEARLVGRGWGEYLVVTLPSPRAFLMERLARAGFAKAFPEELDPNREWDQISVEGARRYLDRDLDRVGAAMWLETHALMPDPWAFLRFVDRYRSFVVAYTYRDDGEDFDDLIEAWWNGHDES